MPDKIDTICLITYQRSGSTILRYLLNCFNDVFISMENNGLVVNLLDYSLNIQAMNSIINYSNDGDLLDTKSFGINLNIDNLQNDIRNLLNNSFLNSNYKIKGWKEFNISPFVANENKCNVYLNEIKSIYQNCLMIFNIRDPLSTSKSGFWKTIPNSSIVIEKNNNFFYEYYSYNKEKSIFLDFNTWSNNENELINIMKSYNIDVNYELYKKNFNTKLNHLKDW